MSRRCLSIAATLVLAACPGPAGQPSTRPAAAGDTALRIRIAQAEARRAAGSAELMELARRGSKPERLLALRGLGRLGALGATGATGAPGVNGALTDALGDPDPEVVGAAAAAIGVAASLDDDRDLGASDALVAALPRGGGPVVEALGRAGTAAVQPALVAALGDARLAALAGLALGRHGRRKIALAEPSRQALIAATASGDPAVRYAAVYALAREHQPPDHPASAAALVGRLGDPVAEIRAQAIAGLGRRKAVAAAGAAGPGLLLDRDWRVAVEAVRALGDSDDGKDAIAAAIVRRFDELERGEPAAAQVVVEGERVLAAAAGRPVVATALSSLIARARAAAGLPPLTRGWIECLAIAALERARRDPDLDAVGRCGLADPLRLPLVADLISAEVGPVAARRTALDRLLTHADPRVRAAGLGALAALWKTGDAADRGHAIAAATAAVGSRDLNVASAAVDAASALHGAAGGADRALLAPLDAALVARARAERDPELGAALLDLIGKHQLVDGIDACRGALAGDPVRARAGKGCLHELGEETRWSPPPATPPPVDISAVVGKALRWRLATTRGEIVIALHPDVAPWAVAAIAALTRRGFYDGIAFHRVVPDFVVQGGDPSESGSGGPGFALPAEPGTMLDGVGYLAGGVGIADAGRDSGGSQWFVMHSRAPHLDGRYTWIGTVESGQNSADALLIGDRVVHAAIELAPPDAPSVRARPGQKCETVQFVRCPADMAIEFANRPDRGRVRSRMQMRTRALALGVLAAAVPGGLALAKAVMPAGGSSPAFQLVGRPLGGAKPAAPTPAYLTGSRIMAAGEGALAIDADSGALIRTDPDGQRVGQLAIARDAGLMTFDPAAGIAYVADRRGDRIAVVRTDTMTIASSIRTPAEPYGVALTPDRSQLLVSTIADRTLVAYDVATGRERWRTALGSEPRGIAVSPDGTRALVAYLTTGTVDQIDLRAHRADHIALDNPASPRRCRHCGNDGDSFARGAFAVTFLGDHLAVAPFQREVPVQDNNGAERVSSYGGGAESPIIHQLAFLGLGGELTEQATAVIAQHQPRALAWDAAHDALYVAGLGTDTVLQIRNASQASIAMGAIAPLTAADNCGPDGLAVTASGRVLAWCSFTRSVTRIEFTAPSADRTPVASVSPGPTLIASAMTARQHDGLVLFHMASAAVSQQGNLACASCHPDNRADGLSWRIEKHELQTPVLAGRVVGTHPYKWDGGDATLRDSLRSTMQRLGGSGLSRRDTDALAAYLEALPAIRTPTRDPVQVARGRKVFDGEGCRSCHDGPAYTDQQRHKLAGTLRESDTPSLLGVAASAPYFHDGSAATLESLLRDRGAVHGMADTARLTDQEVADLAAFLDTL